MGRSRYSKSFLATSRVPPQVCANERSASCPPCWPICNSVYDRANPDRAAFESGRLDSHSFVAPTCRGNGFLNFDDEVIPRAHRFRHRTFPCPKFACPQHAFVRFSLAPVSAYCGESGWPGLGEKPPRSVVGGQGFSFRRVRLVRLACVLVSEVLSHGYNPERSKTAENDGLDMGVERLWQSAVDSRQFFFVRSCLGWFPSRQHGDRFECTRGQ